MSKKTKEKCPMCGGDLERWHFDIYKILQVMQANGVQAAFAQEDGTFDVVPVDLLAVALKTTTCRTAHSGHDMVGKCTYAKENISNRERVIVGLELTGGWHQIVNECCNFAGLMRQGDDPGKCDECLNVFENEKHLRERKR
jgi:hypothetical protein